jgi:hypothetical protein
MTRRRRLVLVILGVVGAIAILALIAPEDAGPGNLVVLHRFLPRVGKSVSDGGLPSPTSVYVLPVDHRTGAEADTLLRWVESGGRLVLMDPSSAIYDRFDVTTSRVGVVGTTTLLNDCVRPETLGVQAIEVSSSDRLLTSTQGAGCFSRGGASYVLFIPHGEGMVVLTGGSSFLSDASLNLADNAAFTIGILGTGPVVIGPPNTPGVSMSLWAALPTGAKVVIWELIVATTLFALARGRRLGRPVPEEPLSPIPSGELVHATARLYRRGHAVAFCGAVLRRWTADRLTRRTGVARDTDPVRLSAAIGRATGVPVEDLERALAGPDPSNDDELVALGRELETVSDLIEGASR